MEKAKLNVNTQKPKKGKFFDRYFENMNTGALTNSDMKTAKYRIFYFALAALMLLFLLAALVPAVWMILMCFKEPAEIYSVPVKFFPEKIDLSKIGRAWKQMSFSKTYINTVVMSCGAVAADVVICGCAGYVLSRLKPKGWKLINTFCVVMLMLPGNMRLVPLYKEFISFPIGKINLINTFWPIWMMCAANLFDIILFKTSFDSISNSLVEAAKIDGATNLGIFAKIIVPLSVPVILTVSIFTFNGQFGSFFWPLLTLRSEELSVVGLRVYRLKSSALTMDMRMFSMMFAMLPQLVLFVLFQKYFIGGINIGGVKG